MVHNLKAACQAHLRVGGFHEFLHGIACVLRLAVCMRKKFDGRDVGIGIRDPARHQAAFVSLRLTDATDSWDEKSERHCVQRCPEGKRQQEQHVKGANHADHGDEINNHKHHDVANANQDITYREGRLHDLGGNSPSELVLIETHALRKHQAVKIPAQTHREVAEQGLMLKERLQSNDQNARH